jgi:hypothetical protein
MLTDEELGLRLISTEDNFVERKTAGDHKRWIPALVAFANSAPIGFDCVLFIGAWDDGTIEPDLGLESLQRSFSEKTSDVFPPIPYSTRVYRRERRECLAIVVQGSPERPHYAGLPYIRVGTESKKATPNDVARLTAERDPKAYEILKWLGEVVTVEILYPPGAAARLGRVQGSFSARIKDCNQFWVTFQNGTGDLSSVILRRVELNFDHVTRRLKLEMTAL